MAVAKTEETTSGMKDRVRNSRMISSTANRTPAMGALKVAAMAPAAPHAKSILRGVSVSRKAWATVDPRDAPIWAIDPSRPMEPPLPIVRADASALRGATLARILPCFVSTASIIWEVPVPFTSEQRYVVIRPTRSPPRGRIMMSRRTFVSSTG